MAHSYLHDIIYVTIFVQVTSTFSDWFWLAYLVVSDHNLRPLLPSHDDMHPEYHIHVQDTVGSELLQTPLCSISTTTTPPATHPEESASIVWSGVSDHSSLQCLLLLVALLVFLTGACLCFMEANN